MRTYLIRLNGAPFLVLTCPAYMDPVTVVTQYMQGIKTDDTTVESARKGVNYDFPEVGI
jgi:hypothetical protein